MLTLTLVIPVFNEERHIKACLDSIKNQTVMPTEVIVVDNNCTDQTIDIVRTYPFARVVKETKQGRGWARTAGFDAANCQIIGRIDADSRLDRDWVETVIKTFQSQPEVFGQTGLGRTLVVRLFKIYNTFWSQAYYWYVHSSFRLITMWGANMAIRREAWLQVRPYVCNDDRIVHEDQDLSLLMAVRGMKIIENRKMFITTEGETYNYLPKIFHYWRLHKRTKKLHRSRLAKGQKFLHKLGFWYTLPGRIGFSILTFPFLIMSIVSLPFDLIWRKVLKLPAK
jgi:glycosyltransferase involved in cell wall biosynthesis